jgi:hypothetical protein
MVETDCDQNVCFCEYKFCYQMILVICERALDFYSKGSGLDSCVSVQTFLLKECTTFTSANDESWGT